MPRRQLANLRIDALEKLFDGKRSNPAVLTTILGELAHRRTPRARKLRQRVVRALSVGPSGLPKWPDTSPLLLLDETPKDDIALFILTPAQHRRVAEIYRKGGPDWTAEERTYAAKLAEHHEMVANGIERRQQRS